MLIDITEYLRCAFMMAMFDYCRRRHTDAVFARTLAIYATRYMSYRHIRHTLRRDTLPLRGCYTPAVTR